MDKILIIGYGKLGSHLFYALKDSPGIEISGIFKNSRSRYNPAVVKNSGIIFICVQDSKINRVVKKLLSLKISLKNKHIFHTSGSLNSGELKDLAVKGALTASFHPVQTFEKPALKTGSRFSDIYAAIEGKQRPLNKARKIAKKLGSKPFVLTKENKVFHHLCCVMSSNFLCALARNIEKTGAEKIQKNGFNKTSFFNIYMPLAEQTLKNIAEYGAARSLSGPIERNDVNTIIKHLGALKEEHSDIYAVYILMGIETVNLALEKKSITIKEAENILKLFSKHLNINKIH